ncbi:MAG: hypothetical protein GF350_14870 [Chitinivibrionales bacterium]|nr:hypothetical protein [Chitinivibrionales bacterium]
MKYRIFGPFDIIIIALLLLISAIFLPLFQAHAPSMVVVYRDSHIIARYPLSQDAKFTVEGIIGPVTIRIRNKTVSVVRSTCRRQICVATTPISRAGRQIVCAPNHVLVQIESSSEKKAPDAIAR